MKKIIKDGMTCSLYERTLIEASLDPFVTISKEGKITDVNKATEEVTGVKREQIVGTDFSDYFVEPEKAREGYTKALLKGFVRDYSLTIRHQSGKLTHVLYNASVYKNEKFEIEGVFAIARDITKTKEIEKKLNKKVEEMAVANDLMVGREMRIIELKKKVEELEEKLKELGNK